MDMQQIKDEIHLQLTGDILELELSDTALTRIINVSLREVQRYIDLFTVMTIPYERCIDLSNYKISSVIGVRRSEGYMGDTETGDSMSSGAMDPLYASQWQLLSGLGNVGQLSNYAYNYAAWNSLLQIRNTTSTDLAHYFDKASKKLYINVSSNVPTKITILYIPRFDSVEEINSDYWIDILIRMAIAQAKIAVGRVRTKFKQSNALWTLDGDALLQEGITELTNLRQELKDSSQLVYGID